MWVGMGKKKDGKEEKIKDREWRKKREKGRKVTETFLTKKKKKNNGLTTGLGTTAPTTRLLLVVVLGLKPMTSRQTNRWTDR